MDRHVANGPLDLRIFPLRLRLQRERDFFQFRSDHGRLLQATQVPKTTVLSFETKISDKADERSHNDNENDAGKKANRHDWHCSVVSRIQRGRIHQDHYAKGQGQIDEIQERQFPRPGTGQ